MDNLITFVTTKNNLKMLFMFENSGNYVLGPQ